MGKGIHVLTPEEIDIFNAGTKDPNITLGYLFHKPGMERPFQLDYNFTEDGVWQKAMCMAKQTFIVAVCGIGSGKSLGVGMSAFYHCIQTDGFKFLNVAAELWQATQMHELIMQFADGCVAEQFISSAPMGAHPKIVVEYLVPPTMKRVKSTIEILSFGEKGDAKNILSWRGDWVNLEEAFRITDLGGKVSTLSTRLTGSSSTGRPYMGRMSLITNPLPNAEGWMLYDQAAADEENGLAIEIETSANKNVTDEQVKRMLALIPEKDRQSFTTGKRPEGAGKYFTRDTIEQCEDKITSEILLKALSNSEKGFIGKHRPRLGYYHFEMPPKEGRVYYMLGDPGIDNAPKRNSPVWMVFDVTDAPRLTSLQALWWGSGNGKIDPWVLQMIEFISRYKPILAGVDNTGTQKNTAEIITKEYLDKDDMSVKKLTGFDFSGSKKMTYLLCLKLAIENSTITWPSLCQGIGDQLQNYDPAEDKAQASKTPNDLVAALSMAAFKIRSSFGASTKDGEQDAPPPIESSLILRRSNREYPSAFRDSRRYPQTPTRKKTFGSGGPQ